MFRPVRPLLVIALLAAAAAPAAGRTVETLAEITGDRVRLRAGPGAIHAALDSFDKKTLVIVVGREGAWARVRVPGGVPAFVHSSLVEVADDGTGRVTGDRVLLRPMAGKDLPGLETLLAEGDLVAILDRSGDWLKVLAPDRVHAYVHSEYVREIGPADEYRARIARAAEERRARLLAAPSAERERLAAERRRRADREAVVQANEAVLAGEPLGPETSLELTRIAAESDDELVRGLAENVLALGRLRETADELAERLKAAEAESEEARALAEKAAGARAAWEQALAAARKAREGEGELDRATGRIVTRGDQILLEAAGMLPLRLTSDRFRLSDYDGRRVGLAGRLGPATADGTPRTFAVERIVIMESESSGR